MVDAMNYCHKEKLIHRDLKLENIMLLNPTSKVIKIVDFGIAGMNNNFNLDKINVGSLKYMAPEVLSNKIDKVGPSIDIWALGVILFTMVIGEMPFNGNDALEIVENICQANCHVPDDVLEDLSKDFVNLL